MGEVHDRLLTGRNRGDRLDHLPEGVETIDHLAPPACGTSGEPTGHLINRLQQQPRIVGKRLSVGSQPATDQHHRSEIVWTEEPFEKLPKKEPRLQREIATDLVHSEHVDAAWRRDRC